MNEERQSAPEESIIEKILSDGEAQAKRVIDSARRSEAHEKRKAAAEAERIRAETLARAETKADTIRSKLIATGHIEAKRVLLKAREEAIQKVFALIEQDLASVRRDSGEYRRALGNLAVEAISAIDEPEVTLKIGKEDEQVADRAFLTEIKQRLTDSMGKGIRITLDIDPRVTGGGCVAVGGQGRIVLDNTFRRRLDRMRPALRSMIVREVLKTDG